MIYCFAQLGCNFRVMRSHLRFIEHHEKPLNEYKGISIRPIKDKPYHLYILLHGGWQSRSTFCPLIETGQMPHISNMVCFFLKSTNLKTGIAFLVLQLLVASSWPILSNFLVNSQRKCIHGHLLNLKEYWVLHCTCTGNLERIGP